MLEYRPPTAQDFEALQALDVAHQRRLDPAFDTLEEREREGRLRTSLAALKFFERSEHSFVAAQGPTIYGLLLAQSVWQGDRPTVLVVELITAADAPPETAQGLLHACIKSAYDTAVYEVHFPLTDELRPAAQAEEARVVGQYAVCHLGTRSQTAPGTKL